MDLFPEGYKELGTIKAQVRKTIEARQKDINAGKNAATEFEKTLKAGQQEKLAGKGTAKLAKLKSDLTSWLGSHKTEDAAGVFSVYEQCVHALGENRTSSDLTLISRQLEQQVIYAVAPFQGVKDQDLKTTLEKTGAMGPKLFNLIERVEGCLKDAEKLGNKMVLEQCKRYLIDLRDLDARLLGVDSTVSVPKKQDVQSSDLLDSEDEGQDVKAESKEEKKPAEKPQVVLDSDDADTALEKTSKAIDIFSFAKTKTVSVVDEFELLVQGVEKDSAKFKQHVEEDIALLKVCIERAKSELEFAQQRLERCIREQKLGEQGKEDELEWKTSIRNIGVYLGEGREFLEKAKYQVSLGEGGIMQIHNVIDSFESLKNRLAAIDESLIGTVEEKLKLVPECKKVAGADPDTIEMVTRLAFVSALPEDKIRQLLALPAQGKDDTEKAKKLDQMIQSFINGPQLSTLDMTSILARSHQLISDVSRFFANDTAFTGTLDGTLTTKWHSVKKLTNQDLGPFLAPVVYNPGKNGDEIKQKSKYPSVGVAIVGGGPIGLLAAIEARLRGASQVHVYEGRSDPYSRLNVLKFTDPSLQRMKQVGVFEAIWPKGNPGPASVKTIENALESRCSQLGIKLERGKFLSNVTKDENGKTVLYFKGEEDSPKYCDLMVLATGASITSAKNHADNIALSDKLGIPFQKSEVVDLAAVGVFTKAEGDAVPQGGDTYGGDGWAYGFETDDLKYVVSQLSEEEFEEFTAHPEKLRDRLRDDAIRGKLGNKRPEVLKQFDKRSNTDKEVISKFPIEIQQALTFAREELNLVLIGDSAGTPHPSTALGLNTGIAEMGALESLVESLESGDPNDPEIKKKAMQLYDWEVKRKTDNMVNKAMNAMVDLAYTRCRGYVDAVAKTLPQDNDQNDFNPSFAYQETCITPFRKELEKLKPTKEEIKDDISWSVREEATKKLRSMEKDIKAAVAEARKKLTDPVTQDKLDQAWLKLKKVFE